jgi:hypothetical protein
MPQMPRYRAFARISLALKPETQAIHSVVTGLDETTGALAEAYFPVADVLVLEAGCGAERGAMLYRYTADGVFGGDTWHESVKDALDQATFEYGAAIVGWHEIPPTVADATEYALTQDP